MLRIIIIVSLLLTTGIFGFLFYSATRTSPAPVETSLSRNLNPSPIAITDGFQDGIHRISGTVKLAHSCYGVTTVADYDEANARIDLFLTSRDNFDRNPSSCARYPTQYPFSTIAEAPQDVSSFRLFLDGDELMTSVRRTDWQDPSGNIINSAPIR